MKKVIQFLTRTSIALMAGLFLFSANAATVVSSCNPTAAAADGVTMLKTCAPEITFYAAGSANVMRPAIEKMLSTHGRVFDRYKPFVTIKLSGAGDAYAYYGYGAAGKPYMDKRVAVIVNGTNGSMAGVNQLLTGLKKGSVLNGVDNLEYITIQLHTAAAQKAGLTMADTDLQTVTNYDVVTNKLTPIVTLASHRVADFKTGWGIDKQKVAHMAFSDVRPSEFPPGMITSWDPKAFPAETIAMQGFGVLVNNNMYKALMARDVREGEITDLACDASDASMLLSKCQPGITLADYSALMKGNITSAAEFVRDKSENRVLNHNRRIGIIGSQIATQIIFAGQANYAGKAPLATGFAIVGKDTIMTNIQTLAVNPGFNVITHWATAALVNQVKYDYTGLSIGVASLAHAYANGLGFGLSPESQTARWIKLDRSPNFKPDGSIDTKLRTGLQLGYPFVFEFVTLKPAKLMSPYLDIANEIVSGLKDPANDVTGFAYIASYDGTKNTTWTRGGNNYFPLSKY
ncbi:hypothetical protein [Limnohabitans sp.]|uniref:hypothetical protein n=1 Tax=Limnohabitans sp. TaxID=1907725 RepID=UPI0038BBAAC1